MLNLEMDIAESKASKWFTTKEVDAMLAEVDRKASNGKVVKSSRRTSNKIDKE